MIHRWQKGGVWESKRDEMGKKWELGERREREVRMMNTGGWVCMQSSSERS